MSLPPNPLPPKDKLLEKFLYLEKEGVILNKRTLKQVKVGSGGYIQVKFCDYPNKDRLLSVHRIIFFLETGLQPNCIDHIDGNKLNNHISNLRESNSILNSGNSISKRGKSKYKGVHFAKGNRKKPWKAELLTKDSYIFLGYFFTEEEAAKAYDEAARIYFGEHARLNF